MSAGQPTHATACKVEGAACEVWDINHDCSYISGKNDFLMNYDQTDRQ